MKMRLEDKKRATTLRLQGKTYNEIIAIIPDLSKSTLSGWLQNLEFTAKQKRRLEKRIEKNSHSARERSNWARGKKRRARIQKITKSAKEEYPYLSKNLFFILCLALYWAEGNKKSGQFQFTNSDPRAIKAIMRWLLKTCKVSKEDIKIRLYTHKIFANENYEKFWSEITKIPISDFQKTIFKDTPHKTKKNINYKGCIQLRVLKSALQWKVITWMQELTKEYRLN